jgi:hypothetical protein
VSVGRSDRVANAIKQRDQILEQISLLNNYQSFSEFFENYTSRRLTRLNDRENSIFLKALLDRLNNNRAFLTNLTPSEKFEVIQTLVNYSHIFARGSAQFHVPLELSEKYFADFVSKEDLYSILEMCRLQNPLQ